MSSAINVSALEVGSLGTCCYLVAREGEKSCVCVDPGGEGEVVASEIEKRGLTLDAILITHCHFDHIGGVAELKSKYPESRVLCHEICSERMQVPEENLGFLVGVALKAPKADTLLKDGERFTLAGLDFTALFVPGHAPGHMAYYLQESGDLFAGDVLFNGSLGRTDFPGCSYEELSKSIVGKILVLPDETKVWPGHGPGTTVGDEKRSNPFLKDMK